MENFGFKKVSKEDKPKLVNKVFDSVAFRYDLMNDLMSVGLHRLWKDSFIDWLAPRKNSHLLDVAGGTGDIGFRFIKRTKNQARVTILDRNENMLKEGKRRSNTGQIDKGLEWVCGDAMKLPFEKEAFDYYTISFGIRNVLDLKKCLSEAFRVLKPGGRIMILEFSKIDNQTLNKIYDACIIINIKFGIHCLSPAYLKEKLSNGYDLATLASDVRIFAEGLSNKIREARS